MRSSYSRQVIAKDFTTTKPEERADRGPPHDEHAADRAHVEAAVVRFVMGVGKERRGRTI
jgi:hypothetical protein